MSDVEIPVSRETAQALRIVLLEHECAQLRARLLQAEAERLLEHAERAYHQTVDTFLARLHPDLPYPTGPLTLDVEAGVVRYSVPETALTVDTS